MREIITRKSKFEQEGAVPYQIALFRAMILQRIS